MCGKSGPGFLKQTLESLFASCDGLDADVFVVDNGSDDETRQVIVQESRLAGYRFLGRNLGINGALEAVVPDDLPQRYRCVLVSDADMLYQQPLSIGINMLDNAPVVGAVSYQHSPEHPIVIREFDLRREWILKESERGCALMIRAADFQALRPLPVENMKDFDWWVMRDSPNSLMRQGRRVAVLPGGACHLGWRRHESTWQPDEILEYAEYRR